MSQNHLAATLNEAALEYARCQSITAQLTASLPIFLNEIECFKGASLIGDAFRQKGTAAQIYVSANPDIVGMKASFYNILIQGDGTYKVSHTIPSNQGGSSTLTSEPGSFARFGTSKDDVIRDIFLKIAGIDPNGFGNFLATMGGHSKLSNDITAAGGAVCRHLS